MRAGVLERWQATDAANQAIRAGPADQIPLREIIEANSAIASSEVVIEAKARLNVLVHSDAGLSEAQMGSLLKLRSAISEWRDRASPAVLKASEVKQHEMEEEVDRTLRVELAAATEAVAVKELHERNADVASLELLEKVKERVAMEDGDAPPPLA